MTAFLCSLLLLLCLPVQPLTHLITSEADLLVPAAAASPFYPAPAVSRLHAALRQQQHPASCSSARLLLVQYSAESGVNGFAAMFQFLAGALGVARALNRTLVEAYPARGGGASPDPWLRAPSALCGGLKLGCFMAPLSSCGALGWGGGGEGAAPAVAPSLQGALAQAHLPALALRSLGSHHGLLFEATRGSGPGAPPWWPAAVGPSGCVYQGAQAHPAACARRLYFAALQAYLFAPLPRITTPLQAPVLAPMLQQARAGAAVFALHVRRGDAAALPWRSSAALEDYLAVAQQGAAGERRAREAEGWLASTDTAGAAASPTPSHTLLYLATDSAVVRGRAAAAAAAANFTLLTASTPPVLLTGSHGGGEVTVHTESYIAQLQRQEGGQGGLLETSQEAAAAAAAAEQRASALPPLQDYLPTHALLAVGGGGREAFLAAYAASHPEGSAAAAAAAHAVVSLTDGVIADILALSHATHFVGTCLSQVSRLAYDLAYAAGRAQAAPVGLDAQACRAHPVHFFPIAADWREGFDVWTDG